MAMANLMVIHAIDLHAQLLACRVCLATDTKLFHLPTHPIAQTYALLTGTALSLTDGLPQHICSLCSSQLLKHAALRAKCRTSQVILQVAQAANQLVTTDYLRNLDRTHLKHNLFPTNTQNIDISPKKPSNLAREFNSSFTQQIDLTLDDDEDVETILPEYHPTTNYENPNTDCDENNEQIFTEIIKSDDNTFGYIAENIDYTSIKSDDISSDNDNDESFLPDCLIGIASDVFKDSKENFQETKSENKKNNFTPESKEKGIVATKTTIKKRKIERHINKKSVQSDAQKRKRGKNWQVRKENQTNFANNNDCKERVTLIEKGMRFWSNKQLAELSRKYNFDIVILSKEDQRKRIEARKETENYKNSQFRCEICFRGFIEESRFASHMTCHDTTNQKHVCDICHCFFKSKKYLSAHKRRHSMNIPCKECDHVSKNFFEAKQHFKWHKGVTFDCEHCGKSFKKIKSRFEHSRIHHGYTPCSICGNCFVGQNGLKAHMIKSHKEAVDAVCSTCNVQFHSTEALSKHACEPGALPCAQCGDSFPDEEALKDHKRLHSTKRIKKQTMKFKLELKCLECGDTFTSEKLHRMHLYRVHNIKPSLAAPTRQDEGKTDRYKNKYVCICEICGKFMPSQAVLRGHQRIHTGEKPFQCDHCNKRFRLKVHMQDHIFTHTGERLYKCDECPMSFKTATGRYRHRLVHSKERPYICQLCGKTFQQSTDVKIHIRTAHLKEAWPKRIRPSRKKKTKMTD